MFECRSREVSHYLFSNSVFFSPSLSRSLPLRRLLLRRFAVLFAAAFRILWVTANGDDSPLYCCRLFVYSIFIYLHFERNSSGRWSDTADTDRQKKSWNRKIARESWKLRDNVNWSLTPSTLPLYREIRRCGVVFFSFRWWCAMWISTLWSATRVHTDR